MDDLRNSPQIAELLEILDRNGLTKEKDEVNSLVDYIGSMETTLSAMMNELTEMRQEVRQIHDNTLRAKCQQILEKTGEKIKTAMDMVKTTKENFLFGVSQAINAFKCKGKDALIKSIEILRIPNTMQFLEKHFNSLSADMAVNAQRTGVFKSEIHQAAQHTKNAVLSLFGKTSKEAKHATRDRGILTKLQTFYDNMAGRFAIISQKTKKLSEKLADAKASVKADLNSLKKNHSKEKSAPQKEKTR